MDNKGINSLLDSITPSDRGKRLEALIDRKSKAKKRNNTKIHISDFETSTGNKDGSTNVYLWGISSMDKKDRYSGVNLTEFFDTIDRYKLTRVLFHNLKFDGQFILHHITNKGYTFENNNFGIPMTAKTFTWMKDDTGFTYSLIVNTGNVIVKFGDTARLLVSSVERMGAIMGLPKLVIDYDRYKSFASIDRVPHKLLEYLWRDIDVVVDRFTQYKKSFPNHGITAASTALKSFKKLYGYDRYVKNFGGYWKNFLGEREVRNVLTKEQWDLFATGYWGGYNHVKERIKGKDLLNIKGESADANSLYPSVMWKYRFPIGKPMESEPYGDNIIEFKQIFIIEAKLRDPDMFPIIPSNRSKSKLNMKYLSEVYNEYYNIWDIELEDWDKYYFIKYRVIKTWYFRSEYIFKEWVDIQYKKKQFAKDDVEKDDAKINLNSLYGKMAEKWLRVHRILVKDPFKDLDGVRYGADYVEQKETTKSELLSPIHVGGYITALGRHELRKVIYANRKGAVYADTDSVYSTMPIVGVPIDGDKLCYWKYEKRFSRFKSLKCKSYLVQLTEEFKHGEWHKRDKISVTCGGLSTENHHLLNWETYYSGNVLQSGKLKQTNVEGGVILKPIKYTL